MSSHSELYYHSPCFDGIVSAVLTWDFAESMLKWTVSDLRPVNYKLRSTWLTTELVQPCAVVDFLYHPRATFWADHHSTTFLSPAARLNYKRRKDPRLVYDDTASSCAKLLWEHLWQGFQYRNPRYSELVVWATKTDSASYASVEEAIHGTAPALRINASLAYGDDDEYSTSLVEQLRRESLEKVANLPRVRERFERFQVDTARGLAVFKSHSRLEGDVVVFDVASDDVVIPRYAPYYFFPHARYSIGMIRREGRAAITAMRNPWRDFSSVHLGRMFERLGGGGHQRVGSVVLRGETSVQADRVFEDLLKVLREQKSGPVRSRTGVS